jgi:hypothetical protein
VDIDDLRREQEKPEAGLAASLIGDDEDDAVLRDQTARAGDSVVVPNLAFPRQGEALEPLILQGKAPPSRRANSRCAGVSPRDDSCSTTSAASRRVPELLEPEGQEIPIRSMCSGRRRSDLLAICIL